MTHRVTGHTLTQIVTKWLREHKSRAFYRIQATRNMTGGGDIIKNKGDKIAEMKSLAGDVSAVVTQDPDADPSVTRVQFVQKDYRVSYSSIPILQ